MNIAGAPIYEYASSDPNEHEIISNFTTFA
jgi:hypothetical protein